MAAAKAPANAEEKVEIYIPKGQANEDPNFLISVNGVNYLLPRGKKSMVHAFVAAEYNRSVEAQEALDRKMEELLEASK